MRRRIKNIVTVIPIIICDALGFLGAGCISYGAWLIYRPVGFIVGGALLILGAMAFGSRVGQFS